MGGREGDNVGYVKAFVVERLGLIGWGGESVDSQSVLTEAGLFQSLA